MNATFNEQVEYLQKIKEIACHQAVSFLQKKESFNVIGSSV